MKYRGIFEYEYPAEHKPPVSIDVHLHGDCVKGKIIEWEYRPLEQEPISETDIILTREEYGELVSSEYDNGYAKGYREALEQESKTGHWIPTYGNVKCSVCGSVKDSREVGRATHYCDFCGAKMDQEEEENE